MAYGKRSRIFNVSIMMERCERMDMMNRWAYSVVMFGLLNLARVWPRHVVSSLF